jgi:hypothetical protein
MTLLCVPFLVDEAERLAKRGVCRSDGQQPEEESPNDEVQAHCQKLNEPNVKVWRHCSHLCSLSQVERGSFTDTDFTTASVDVTKLIQVKLCDDLPNDFGISVTNTTDAL